MPDQSKEMGTFIYNMYALTLNDIIIDQLLYNSRIKTFVGMGSYVIGGPTQVKTDIIDGTFKLNMNERYLCY